MGVYFDRCLFYGEDDMAGNLTLVGDSPYGITNITKDGIDIAFDYGGLYGSATLDMVHFCIGDLCYDEEKMLWVVTINHHGG